MKTIDVYRYVLSLSQVNPMPQVEIIKQINKYTNYNKF